jgi:hypothetical protein
MTYNTIATMAEDEALNRRVTAAVASEKIIDPEAWLYPRRWQVAAQPGWASAWESAVAGGVENPGENEGVITDGMILSAVQDIITQENPPPAPEPNPDNELPDPEA